MLLRKRKNVLREFWHLKGSLGNEWAEKGIFLSTFSLGKGSKVGNVP